MGFKWLLFENSPRLDLMLAPTGYLIALVYAALVAGLAIRSWRDFEALTPRQWGMLSVLSVAGFLLAQSFAIEITPSRFGAPDTYFLPVFGLLPMLLAALWLGAGPAILVGMLTGLSGALFSTHRITQPLEIALLGYSVALLLGQRYRGPVGQWLRQPVVAMLLSAIVVGWPLTLLGIFATRAPDIALVRLERTTTMMGPLLGLTIAASVIAGGILQIALLRWPSWQPLNEDELVTPPWERHLGQRMLYTLGPLVAAAIVVLVGVVAATSYRVATRLVAEQMARDAANASSGIPFFIQVGRSLIRNLAQDEALIAGGEAAREEQLVKGLRAVPFFQQLIYLDDQLQPLSAYPPLEATAQALAPGELHRARISLEEGVPAEVTVYFGEEADIPVMVSFIAPVGSSEADAPGGVLVGRTALDTNPILAPVVDLLRERIGGSGEGFLIDSQGRILLYPAHPERTLEVFELGQAVEIQSERGEESTFRQYEADGTRQLVTLLPVAGRSDWSVVILVPNEVALALAVQIALPMLFLLLAMAAVATPLALATTRRITVPLEELLQAVDLISKGELDQPVRVSGEDEIGRLGQAFEEMRVRLKNRLGELERLLNVSRSVSSNLELFRAVPPILSSALDVTRAVGVRVVLRREGDEPFQAYAAGEAGVAMASLDAQVLDMAEKQGTVVISQLWRASESLDTSALPQGIRALVALPLRSDTVFHGVLWLAYDHERLFEQSEMDFLSTLAGQAAIAVSNARLFAEAEEERRKLEAVLESTADGMIVTDNQGRIILMNPAAESYFGIRAEQARGRKATEVLKDAQELAALLTNLQEPVSVLEMPDQRGKFFLASTSTIVSHEGAITGRVAVLRDITALKELDNIKTVFLRMVSHDLRSPLTFMRGYLSMLPLIGDLNERQQEAVIKINDGIDYISEMTERLLYLSRLQFGDQADLEMVLVDVEELIQIILEEQSEDARRKQITLSFECEDKLPLLLADEMLLRQAVANLVNNALKYTPEGGTVAVHAFKDGGEQIGISVRDTGIGIRKEDQARLFEAFYRVPQRKGDPPRPRGSGLGLALVKAIVQAHGGTVRVESEFGEGSTFYITLPVRDPTDPDLQPDRVPQQATDRT